MPAAFAFWTLDDLLAKNWNPLLVSFNVIALFVDVFSLPIGVGGLTVIRTEVGWTFIGC